jgi:hypothetical protein
LFLKFLLRFCLFVYYYFWLRLDKTVYDKPMSKVCLQYVFPFVFFLLKHHSICWWLRKVYKNISERSCYSEITVYMSGSHIKGLLKKLNIFTKFTLGTLIAISIICLYFSL